MTYKELLKERLPNISDGMLEDITNNYCIARFFNYSVPPLCHLYCHTCWDKELERKFPPDITDKILDKFNKLW